MPKYKTVTSPLVSGNRVTVTEGISVADVNRDGILDLIIPSVGNARTPIQAGDPPIAVFFGHSDGTYELADTSQLAPAGWVNDVVFLDSDGDGFPELLSIDHGREIAYRPEYWSPIRIAEWDPASNRFVEKTSLPDGNLIPRFNHNASSVGDLNLDGIPDVAVAQLGPSNFELLYGDPLKVFRDVTATLPADLTRRGSDKYIDAGAAGLFDHGNDGDLDVILLPYGATNTFLKHQSEAVILVFEDGAFTNSFLTPARSTATFSVPTNYGYPYMQFADLDGNGYTDVVGILEEPANTNVFTVMFQQADGTFVLDKAMPAEPLEVSLDGYMTWNGQQFTWALHKFWLNDLDGDGDLDLFWGKMMTGTHADFPSSIFFNDGTGHFYRDRALSNVLFADVSWSGSARTFSADLNQDGIGDFLVIEELHHAEPVTAVNPYGTSQRVTAFLSSAGLSDSKIGSARSESLFGSTGPSTMTGLGGDDLIDGGTGVDTAVFSANRAQFHITRTPAGLEVVDSSGAEGHDRLVSIERVSFSDIGLAFDTGHAQAGGETALLIGATLGVGALTAKKDLTGAVLALMDEGFSLQALSGAVMRLPIWEVLAGGTSSTQIATYLLTTVNGQTPDATALAAAVSSLDHDPQGDFLWHLAQTAGNQLQIDLVGLADRGLEFV